MLWSTVGASCLLLLEREERIKAEADARDARVREAQQRPRLAALHRCAEDLLAMLLHGREFLAAS